MSEDLIPILSDDIHMATKFSEELNVPFNVHPSDFIYQFLISNPVFKERDKAIRYYFYDGNNSAKQLRELIEQLGINPDGHFKLLEFASGYGCVSRHLPNVFPHLDLLCCDIHQQAITFTKDILLQKAKVSHCVPEQLEISNMFDVVFALSFFSHMPSQTWLRWFQALFARVASGGYLIFTTQGKETAEKYMGNPIIPDDGFWFRPDSEQKDLDVAEYGQTVVLKDFIYRQEKYLPGGNIVEYKPAYWWGHQDLWIIKRDSE